MSDALKRLKELTDKIPDHNPGYLIGNKLLIEGGMGVSTALKKTKKVGVAYTELKQGAMFKDHFHPEREIIIVVQGRMRYTDAEKDLILEETDALIIEPKTLHNAEALVDTVLIAVTVPASKGFPNE